MRADVISGTCDARGARTDRLLTPHAGRSAGNSVGDGVSLGYRRQRVVATNMQLAHRPSILQDLEAGRPMEVDALYTVPLEMARLMDVPTPTLDLVVAMIRLKAQAMGLYHLDPMRDYSG